MAVDPVRMNLGEILSSPGGQLRSAGPNTWLWNTRSGAGTQVPAGVYTCRLTAVTDDGEQAQAIALLRVR